MSVRVTVKGPLLSLGVSDEVWGFIRAIIGGVIEAGEQRLRERLKPRPAGVYLSIGEAGKGKYSTGHYASTIHGEVQSSLHGEVQSSLHGVIEGGYNVCIYGPWLETGERRGEPTRFKGYHVFRETGQWLQKEAPGIAEKHTRRFVRKMG